MTVNTRVTVYEGTTTRAYSVDMFVMTCASCGVIFGITTEYEAARRKDTRSFHCPNGHTLSWKQSEADRLARDLAQAVRDRDAAWTAHDAARDQLKASERSLAATKGHVTRLRNRIAAGVCPVQTCQRSFQNVKAHIANKHPEWAHEHEEALA